MIEIKSFFFNCYQEKKTQNNILGLFMFSYFQDTVIKRIPETDVSCCHTHVIVILTMSTQTTAAAGSATALNQSGTMNHLIKQLIAKIFSNCQQQPGLFQGKKSNNKLTTDCYCKIFLLTTGVTVVHMSSRYLGDADCTVQQLGLNSIKICQCG